jgi:hypothetical protein
LPSTVLAAASSTPLDLFAKLKYEGHPGLWHLLLWVISRFTSDPIWMQVAHLLIALGIWALIWCASPFKPFEKFLLLLSYYLFGEYFVLSRNYALGVLFGFGFVALWVTRPEQRFWPWVLLGFLPILRFMPRSGRLVSRSCSASETALNGARYCQVRRFISGCVCLPSRP